MGDIKKDYIIIEGKSKEELIRKGIEVLNVRQDELDIEIIEECKHFMKMKKTYKARISKKIIKKSDIIDMKIDLLHEETEDMKFVLNISEDKMVANGILFPPKGGGNEIDFVEILNSINDNIKFGLIMKNVRQMFDDKIYNKEIVIARGRSAIDDIDAKIDYKFNINKKTSLEVDENGTVNYKNLKLINNVKKGDVLAEITPSIEGVSEINVFGEERLQKKCNALKISHGKHIIKTEDHFKFISIIDGQVYLENNKLIVTKIYTVKSDVDNSTGNIQFNGNVVIEGNVLTGFQVQADGNIEVKGVVEGAAIESKKNIVLIRGMQGHNKGYLSAEENISAKYFENCNVYSKKNVYSEAIMHSNVQSNETVIVTSGKGLIVGGVIRSDKEIHAKNIGSVMGTRTILEVGTNLEMKNKYEKFKQEENEITKQIDTLMKSIKLLKRKKESDNLSSSKEKILMDCLKAYKTLNERLTEIQKYISELEERIEMLTNGQIIVDNIIYPGVKVVIGNSIFFVKKELKSCILRKTAGEIQIIQR